MYFKSLDSRYIVDPNILNVSGALDTFMRCTICTSGTIFSRNKDSYDTLGAEEYFKLHLSESSGSPQLKLFFKTQATATTTINTNDIGVLTDLSTWTHIAVTWGFDTVTHTTTFNVYKNGVTLDGALFPLTVNTAFLQDGANYKSYWGVEEESSSDSAFLANYFDGFMYFVATSNYEFDSIVSDIEVLYSTTCSNFGGCSICPLDNNCLSECEYDTAPDHLKVASTCDISCDSDCLDDQDCGCVRAGSSCNKCYDYHCTDCVNWEQGNCTTCEATITSGSVNVSGDCDCATNFNAVQYTRSDIFYPCCAANCETCSDAK